jgi:glycerophosphoryl diester phosphodiesterase
MVLLYFANFCMNARGWRRLAAFSLALVVARWSVAPANAVGVPLHDSLLTAWDFDVGNGMSLPDTGPAGAVADNGTLRNTPTWITGKFGNALNFNGPNEDVLVPNSVDMNIGASAVTLSAWVKLDQLPSGISGSFSGIFDSEPDNYVMYLDKSANELRFKVTTASGVAERPGVPAALMDTVNWHHVMGVYDGAVGQASIYFDGQLADVHSTPGLTGLVRTGQTAGIGSQVASSSPNAPSNLFKGNIDDIGVWNRALGLAEAQYLYNGGVGNAISAANPTIDPIVPAPPTNPSIAVVAHRGNSIVAPENTYAAVTAAAGYADYSEFDVHVTADNKLIVMHDGTLNRTTNGSGSVGGSNYTGYIDGLDAGSWFSPAFAGEPVPLMKPYVEDIFAKGKTGTPAAIVGELNDIGTLHDTVIIAFDWNFLAGVRALDSQVVLGALGSGSINASVINSVLASGANFLDWSDSASTITQAAVDLVHAAGLELHVWTVDNLTRMQQLIDLGVDGITTNAPQTLRSIVPLPGDYNYDNVVDAADYALWRNAMGDAVSYDTWRANFGRAVGVIAGAGASVAGTAAVPEPSVSLMLLAVGLGLATGRRGVRPIPVRPDNPYCTLGTREK